jgi:acetyl-CoA carboxylase biotin carboxylase subunit
MFKKILIANRGEIAVRIIRTCRDLGIATVALYSATDRDSLHVRLAEECVPITSDLRYGDKNEVLELPKTGAEAIHPAMASWPKKPILRDVRRRRHRSSSARPRRDPRGAQQDGDDGSRCKRPAIRAAYADLPDAAPTKPMMAAGGATSRLPARREVRAGRARARGARGDDSPDEGWSKLDRCARRYEAEMIYGDDHLYLERVMAPSHYLAVQCSGRPARRSFTWANARAHCCATTKS